MEKLELKHIAPYLPYGLKIKHESIDEYATEICNLESLSLDCITFDNGCDYYFEDSDYDNPIIKPLLRPLSDLYKEIDGKVGIVELAKIHDPDFDDTEDVTVTPLTGWSTMGHVDYWNNDGIECRFGWFNSFQAGYINPTRHRFVSNQLDLYTYLFQHHYDVYSLIDKGLAIDLNSISHE